MKQMAVPPSKSLFTFLVGVVAAISLSIADTRAQTQTAMNAEARTDFAKADIDLNKTYQAVDKDFSADVFGTLRFDEGGDWKVINMRRLSDKELKQRDKE